MYFWDLLPFILCNCFFDCSRSLSGDGAPACLTGFCMTVHLKKLSVGSESLARLRYLQAERVRNGMELMHVTRNTPRRVEDVLDGGSIFWVIKGVMCARQPITELRSMQRADGNPACGIVLAPELVAVEPLRVRIFQGWRYLEVKDAPADIPVANDGVDMMPPELIAELRELGLL